ncbi:MAG: hypothetical protein MR279_07930, partial [Bacteroidales bacterium]|nr:hypothetical protein [Bacteroidales bacterium]
ETLSFCVCKDTTFLPIGKVLRELFVNLFFRMQIINRLERRLDKNKTAFYSAKTPFWSKRNAVLLRYN